MNEREAVYVLAVAAAYDNRRPSRVDAQTWAYELKHVDRDTAVAAVREHYRARPDDRIRPGHVLAVIHGRRRLGLDQSSRVEEAALAAIDPDDPHYESKVRAALAAARQAAATDQDAIPAHRQITSSRAERIERNRRGRARAEAELAERRRPAPATRGPEPDISPALAAARARAQAMKGRRAGDPGSLTEAGAQPARTDTTKEN